MEKPHIFAENLRIAHKIEFFTIVTGIVLPIVYYDGRCFTYCKSCASEKKYFYFLIFIPDINWVNWCYCGGNDAPVNHYSYD